MEFEPARAWEAGSVPGIPSTAPALLRQVGLGWQGAEREDPPLGCWVCRAFPGERPVGPPKEPFQTRLPHRPRFVGLETLFQGKRAEFSFSVRTAALGPWGEPGAGRHGWPGCGGGGGEKQEGKIVNLGQMLEPLIRGVPGPQ